MAAIGDPHLFQRISPLELPSDLQPSGSGREVLAGKISSKTGPPGGRLTPSLSAAGSRDNVGERLDLELKVDERNLVMNQFVREMLTAIVTCAVSNLQVEKQSVGRTDKIGDNWKTIELRIHR